MRIDQDHVHYVVPFPEAEWISNAFLTLRSNLLKSTFIGFEYSGILPLESWFTGLKSWVYMVECNCGKKHVGETKLKVQSRICQHKKIVIEEKWDASGIWAFFTVVWGGREVCFGKRKVWNQFLYFYIFFLPYYFYWKMHLLCMWWIVNTPFAPFSHGIYPYYCDNLLQSNVILAMQSITQSKSIRKSTKTRLLFDWVW